MRRHAFVTYDGASGFTCTSMMVDADGYGAVCGKYADDPIHEPRYDQYSHVGLMDFDQDPIPLTVHLCQDCGVVVFDTAVHDRFHDETVTTD